MLKLSIRALLVGLALIALLALAANVFTMPAWSIYVAFIAIIGVAALLQGRDDDAYAPTRASTDPHAHSQ
jgi:hypothetical protein